MMRSARLKYLLMILFGWSLFQVATAQIQSPPDGVLFDPASVSRIDITIHPDSLALILLPGNEQSDHEFPALFKFTRGDAVMEIDSVGFRLRGNTSRYSQKKSFKISLNTFVPGQKISGIEKINLNGEHNDPSISRARICWELYKRIGVPAPRSGHTELYINGEYKGLYLQVEHIDDEFVDLRFGNNSGNLYKCLWPADLNYISDNPNSYKFESDGRRAYELKTNEETDDYSDLAELIDVLNHADPAGFQQTLEPLLNVNSWLKCLVVEVLTGHWDAYSYNKNNFYLYHNQSTGKFEVIPYDPDNTLGITWFDRDWTTRDIYNWSKGGEERPLTERILQNDTYRARYSSYMNQFLKSHYNSTVMDPFVDGIRELISPYALDDLYRTYDYGYSYIDFLNSFGFAQGAHVREGIKPFIAKRNTSALSQLVLTGEEERFVATGDHLLRLYPNPAQEVVFMEWEGEADKVSYTIYTPEGQEVMRGEANHASLRIEIEETLASGLYFVRVKREQDGKTTGDLFKKLLIVR